MIKLQPFLKIISIIMLFFSQDFSSNSTAGFLRVRENKVLDSAGKPVVLKGFNVPFKDFRDVLGEKDIKRIADTGANSIRLVLDYRDFGPSPFKYNEDSFTLLDQILKWCEKYNVYVILDMHFAPGIQNPHDFVVHRERSYEFWNKKEYQERFYALWAEIARRYADRKIIAGYDLLNEGTPPGIREYINVTNIVARKIRTYDKNHS